MDFRNTPPKVKARSIDINKYSPSARAFYRESKFIFGYFGLKQQNLPPPQLPLSTRRDRLTKTPLFRWWARIRLCCHGNPFCMDIPKHAARMLDDTCLVLG